MRNIPVLLMALVLAGLFCPFARSQDKSDEQFVAVGTARARAEIAWRKCTALFQASQQNMNNTWTHIEELNNKTTRQLDTQLNALRAPGAADHNQAAVDALMAAGETLRQAYTVIQRERQGVDTRFQQAAAKYGWVDQVFNMLQNMERAWKDARMDLTLLQGSYEQVARVAEESRVEGERAIHEAQDKQKSWEASCEEASKAAANAAVKPATPADKAGAGAP